MVRITDQLLVSRAEHNEGHLPTLEEISLHQQSLDKIEYINRVCADLKILQFQVFKIFFNEFYMIWKFLLTGTTFVYTRIYYETGKNFYLSSM